MADRPSSPSGSACFSPPCDSDRRAHHHPFTLWFTGLSGAGKTTSARAVHKALGARGYRSIIPDGDVLRNGLNADLGFGAKDRDENIRRVGEVAKILLDTGIIVLAAFISPFKEERARVRSVLGAFAFIEIYINTPIAICEKRDPKGLYARARKGEIIDFTGISSPYEAPKSPEITLDGTCSPVVLVSSVMDDIRARALIT